MTTDARHLCPCGKPIHDGAHMCHACIGTVRRDLRTIAERWDDLESALTTPSAASAAANPSAAADAVLADIDAAIQETT